MTDDAASPGVTADETETDEAAADAETATEGGDGETTAAFELDAFRDVLEARGRAVVTASEVARELGVSQAAAMERLDALDGDVARVDVESDPVVWYPADMDAVADRQRFVVFPDRHELVVDQPTQFTRAQLTQFANLVDTNRDGGYIYEIRETDVWQAPYETFDDLRATMRDVLPGRYPGLEEWVENQWERARQFRLRTHEEGYVVLEAASADLMGNVARQKLDEELRGPISETVSWVAAGAEASIKRTLYEAGYPVQDDRNLETGDDLDVSLSLELRDYQKHWVNEFVEQNSGVFVGPPGSGKTVAAMGVMEAVGGETLILVPSRELATQWREELLADTTLDAADVGEYHGGAKEIRPVTIATYQTAGMNRHRELFDSRKWGLIVYDEGHHVPSPIFSLSADLQSKHRLGLTASPVRGDEREEEIFTLIGPPIGTDWSALFDEGFVQEPEVEIRYVPWHDEDEREEYINTTRHEQRQVAAMNTAKERELRYLLAEHPDEKALVFVDWLEQGDHYSEVLGVPFISGETRHAERERLFSEFRRGELDTLIVSRVGDEGIDLPDAELAVVASGLGGSRRQGTQRAGRTMRPVGKAKLFVLATQGSVEEEFAQSQMRHLSGKGIRVTEAGAVAVDDAE